MGCMTAQLSITNSVWSRQCKHVNVAYYLIGISDKRIEIKEFICCNLRNIDLNSPHGTRN